MYIRVQINIRAVPQLSHLPIDRFQHVRMAMANRNCHYTAEHIQIPFSLVIE